MSKLKEVALYFKKNRDNTAFLTDLDGTALRIVKKPDMVHLSKKNVDSFVKLTEIYNGLGNSLFGFVTGRGLLDTVYVVSGLKRDEHFYGLAASPLDEFAIRKIKKKINGGRKKLLFAYFNSGYGMEQLFKEKHTTKLSIVKWQKIFKKIIEEANLPGKIFLEPKGPIFAVHFREIVESGKNLTLITKGIAEKLRMPAKKYGVTLIEREMVIELWPKNAKQVSKKIQLNKIASSRNIKRIVWGGDTTADTEGIVEIKKLLRKKKLERAVTFFVKEKHNLGSEFRKEIHEENYDHFVFDSVKDCEKFYRSFC